MNNDLWTDGQALTAPRASSRRGFILGSAAAGLGAGFAIASGPVRGTSRDQNRFRRDHVRRDPDCRRWHRHPGLRRPTGKARCGTSTIPVVISEIFGVHEYIADVCRRLPANSATWPSHPTC